MNPAPLTAPASPPQAGPGLVRGIRRLDLVLLAINLIVGAAIFGLPSRIFALAGPWSILGFPVYAVVAGTIVLCYAEVGSRFDGTGGPYLYARYTFGPLAGFMVGWLLWIARMASFSAVGNILLDYLGYLWPAAAPGPWRTTVGAGLVLFYTAINLVPVRTSARMSNLFTAAKLTPLVIFVVVGLFSFRLDAIQLGPPPSLGVASASILLLSFAFGGFESACILAGETQGARHNLPVALLTAIGVAAVLYSAIQLICVGTVPGLARTSLPVADAAARFLGPWGARMIAVGAVVSAAGSLQSMTLAVPRLPFAMAREGLLPRFLTATHPQFHIPYAAVLVTSAGYMYMMLNGTFLSMLTFSLVARLAAYGCTIGALFALRRRKDAPPAAFRAPGGPVAGVLALLLCVWMLAGAKPRDIYSAGIAAGVGMLVYALGWMKKRSAGAGSPAA